jgi:hypothetical protein
VGATALIGAALTLSVACATPPPPVSTQGETTARVQNLGAHTFVSVRVNDSLLDTLFLVDTGATHTILTPTLARRLDLKVPDDAPRQDVTVFGGRKISVPFIRVRRVAVGTASVPDISVAIYDAFPDARVIDGVLGTDFLHRFRMTLDTAQGVLRLRSVSAGPESARAEAAPARAASTGLGTVQAPVWRAGNEWEFRWHSPRGKGTFVWSLAREEIVDGTEFYVVAAGRGREILYRKSDLALYLERVPAGIESRNVPMTAIPWPLRAGKSWDLRFVNERPLDRQTEEIALHCAAAEESVTVPAGRFVTLKIGCHNANTGHPYQELWYSPDVRQRIKERRHFDYGVRERELIRYRLD